MEQASSDKIKEEEQFDTFIRAILNTGIQEPSEIELDEMFSEFSPLQELIPLVLQIKMLIIVKEFRLIKLLKLIPIMLHQIIPRSL